MKWIGTYGFAYNKNMVWLTLDVSHLCPYHCSYCTTGERIVEKGMFTKQEFEIAIQNIKYLCKDKPMKLVICAYGEPTTNDHLQYLIENILQIPNIVNAMLITNLYRDMIWFVKMKKFKNLQKLLILCTLHESQYSLDNVDNFIDKIDLLKLMNVSCIPNVILTNDNVEDVYRIVLYIYGKYKYKFKVTHNVFETPNEHTLNVFKELDSLPYIIDLYHQKYDVSYDPIIPNLKEAMIEYKDVGMESIIKIDNDRIEVVEPYMFNIDKQSYKYWPSNPKYCEMGVRYLATDSYGDIRYGITSHLFNCYISEHVIFNIYRDNLNEMQIELVPQMCYQNCESNCIAQAPKYVLEENK